MKALRGLAKSLLPNKKSNTNANPNRLNNKEYWKMMTKKQQTVNCLKIH